VVNLDKNLSNNVPADNVEICSTTRTTPENHIYFKNGVPTAYTGDVVFKGDVGTKDGVAGTSQIGGVVSSSVAPVNNVECYCTINAPTATSVGFIMATPRVPGSAIATNCKIGGTLIGEYDPADFTNKTITLDESNFHNYIFGSGDTLPLTYDDSGNALGYTFTIENLTGSSATITFTKR
jgi:hypothetical protein